nr:CTL-like protein DDB_G0288717 [Ipomoea batatas]
MAASEEDSNKLSSTLIDPTQPLLSKPYPTIDDPIAVPHHPSSPSDPEDQSQFLQISYNYGPRSIKDLPYLILFLLLVLSTFGFGIYASVNRNPDRFQVSSYVYDYYSFSCTLRDSSNLLSLSVPDSSVLESLIWTLVFTLLFSFPFVLFVLFLLKRYTKQIVYSLLPFFIIIPVALNLYWFVACTVSSTCSDAFPLAYRILVLVFVFLIIAVIVWIFVVNWHRIELTVTIIGVAANALSKNLRLFVVLPALTLGLFVYYAPIVVFLVFARMNGEIVPKEEHGEYSCHWRQDKFVPAYYALAILTMLWSATTLIEAQVYVISGTIAQWYFSKDDTSPKKSMRSSLRNAFGPSSGTICFSGLIVCVVRMVRAMVDNARQEAPGIVNLILRFCVNTLLSAIDFLNKFTIIFAAITGESYCTSAEMTYELLERNLLSTVIVEIVSTRILAGISFVLSAIYAIVVCIILKAVVHLGMEAYLVSAAAWLLLIVVLSFFVLVLDNVVDTVYVCYAIDRDRGEVSKQKVHEVYVHLPISRSIRSPFAAARSPPLSV